LGLKSLLQELEGYLLPINEEFDKMKKVKTVLLFLLLLTLYLEGAKWKKLKPIDSYDGSRYHLKENVAYMEIRLYQNKNSREAMKILALYRKPLESYPKDIITKFKALRPNYSDNADIKMYGNAFFIDTDGKMFQMDMQKDIISLLGDIDRDAEVELLLWLKHVEYASYYKKSAKGYKIKIAEPLTKCAILERYDSIYRRGEYHFDSNYRVVRSGCKKRVNTQFIYNKKINYEYYSSVAIDDSGYLYVVGEVKKSRREDASSFWVLQKYHRDGKRLWSRRVGESTLRIIIADKTLYLFDYNHMVGRYSLNGKKISKKVKNIATINKKGDISIFGREVPKRVRKSNRYLPDGLPNKEERLGVDISDYVEDKKGNTYIVGSEIFYPSGRSDEIPDGACGNTEEVRGAIIAKLNSRGETIWAKVIDRDE